ncbi:HD domain-containing protein [Candidatus Fermentibacteria bacterium]|nr:HD domain-containing protein [Candidatus Fermentibacteria bacterium]
MKALAESLSFSGGHPEQVSRLSLLVFDQLAGLHGLGHGERLLLHCGAALHDIGLDGGKKGHHLRAFDRIMNCGTLGLDERGRTIVSLLAKYHRKSPERNGDPAYLDLDSGDRRIVDLLAGILRVSDGLDRTHCSAVRSVICSFTARTITLVCLVPHGEGEEEKRYGLLKGDLLEEAFCRKLRILLEHTKD